MHMNNCALCYLWGNYIYRCMEMGMERGLSLQGPQRYCKVCMENAHLRGPEFCATLLWTDPEEHGNNYDCYVWGAFPHYPRKSCYFDSLGELSLSKRMLWVGRCSAPCSFLSHFSSPKLRTRRHHCGN